MKLKSAVFVNRIKAAFTQPTGVSATTATYNRIVSEAEAGNFIYFAKYFDTYYIRDGARPSDQLTFSFFKEFDSVEVVSTVDVAFADIGKGLSDTVNFADADSLSKNLDRPAADTFVVSDVPSKGIAKAPFTDAFSVEETSFRTFGKHIGGDWFYTYGTYFDSDYVYRSTEPLEISYFADEAEFAFSKSISDPYAVTDFAALSVSKTLSDSALLSETSTLGISKFLSSDVYATDDVDGAASILDDQEMQYFKNTTNTASVAESFDRTVAYVRAFSDTSALVDDQTISIGKSLSDTPTVAESTNVLTSKHIYDIPVASELLSKAFSRPRSDSALIGDANTVALDKLLQDLASTTDAGLISAQSFTSDAVYFAEDYVGASRTF